MGDRRDNIELILSQINTELLTLSMRDNQLSKNENHLIHTIQNALPEIRSKIKDIYSDNIINRSEAKEFNDLLKEVLYESLKIARLDNVIAKEENALIEHVRNKFIQILRELQIDLNRRSPNY